MALRGTSVEQQIWNYFKDKGLNEFGIAGLMGNLYAESALNPKNLQNTYEKKLGYSDTDYTQAVDNGIYNNFVKDSAGYGLAQWTYWSRKQALLSYAKSVGKSIGDLEMQLGFLYKELSEKFNMDITASGGVSDIDDIKALRKLDLYGAIIGKAYYIGAIDLKEALEATK